MSRRLAALFAVVSVTGSAIAVWLVVVRGDRGASVERPAARAVHRNPAPEGDRGSSPARRFTVSVSGDLLMHQPLLDRALANGEGAEYDFAPFFEQIQPYVEGVDLAICHVETPMGPGPPSSYPIFNTPTGLAASIHRSGWGLCDTASNHSLDQGQPGIDGTARALDRAGVEHTGSFSSKRRSSTPTIVGVRGVKLGFVAYTDATNGIGPPHPWSLNTYPAAAPKQGAKAIIADARAARDRGAEAVIAQIQWGDENSQTPNASQVAVASRLTDANVISAVVGQGPHVVQPIERLHGKFVVFSEGNLVSNQAASTGLPAATEDGIIALLHFRAAGERVEVRRVTYVPTWVRLGDYAVLAALPGAGGPDAEALAQSRRRTIAVVGRGEGFGPER